MIAWQNFFVAIAGASAALTGLLFVGVSLSLAKMLEAPWLPGRALESLLLLLTILVIACLCLVPEQTPLWVGWELIGVGGVIWSIVLRLDTRMLRTADAEYRKHYVLNFFLSQVAVLPYLVAGGVVLCKGFGGLYWMIPGILFSFIKALVDAWILLIEIHR